ncbi:MAG: 16S rRNA (guanine(527)-N(7))-methyltransferase RsmG [Sphaerochaetaceae bacterium]
MDSDPVCMELLRQGAAELGIPLSVFQEKQFNAYLRELAMFNKVYKLVAAEGRDLIVKHVLDSMAAVPVFRRLIEGHAWPSVHVCDVGSGAGFPGIPLAIMLDSLQFTLVERSGRRTGFLRNALAVCNLVDRVEVLEKDLSEVAGSFQLVTFRAFHPLPDILGSIGRITADDGVVCAYKGKSDETEKELQAIGSLVERGKSGSPYGWKSTLVPLLVPFLDAQRQLCLLEKHTST